ncbi:MAG: diadenylate cyclase [Microthrixaceae bacterium]
MTTGGRAQNGVEGRRKQFIVGELAEHDVLTQHTGIRAELIEHLNYALFSDVHEGQAPNYGAILTEGDWDRYDPGDEIFGGIAEIDCGSEVNRQMADGLSSFVWSRPSSTGRSSVESLISFKSARFVDELLTYHLRLDARSASRHPGGRKVAQPEHDFIVVQHFNGLTRVLADTGVLYIEGNRWQMRPYAYNLALASIVEKTWPDLPSDQLETLKGTAERLATVALHVLSAGGIGTTLVLLREDLDCCIKDETFAILDTLDLGEDYGMRSKSGLDINLKDRPSIRPFENLARQLDGAFVVNPDGTVQCARVWLNLGAVNETRPIRSSLGGTRQRSAENASGSLPGIVLTVSSDGPVRVFALGDLAASTVPGEVDGVRRQSRASTVNA